MTGRTKLRAISRADILPLSAYDAVRANKRAEVRAEKRHRQVHIGPHATFTFETYTSMWVQVHEMLRAEKGGDAQIDDELAAYNPLIPNGRELTATMMLEIENERLRATELVKLGGIEETIRLRFAGETVAAMPERDVDRTDGETGKTSSVHFLHFPFSQTQIGAFQAANVEVTLEFTHPRYRHATVLPEETRAALAADFDAAVVR